MQKLKKWVRKTSDYYKYCRCDGSSRHIIFAVDSEIPRSQVDGLRCIAKEQSLCLDIHEWDKVNIEVLAASPDPCAVWLQSWWDSPREDIEAIIQKVRAKWPNTKLIYLDWFAPTDLRNGYLFDLCDIYVKKNLLVDISLYEKGFFDTNLVEFESQYDKSFSRPRHGGIARKLLDSKLRIGWGFGTQFRLQKLLSENAHLNQVRDINIHCRIAAPKCRDTWYGHMRGRCLDAAMSLDFPRVLAESKGISWKQYIHELKNSKICFSPFGYGEVCWRDFEAIACGALLIKPDMSHMTVMPNIFVPFETYLPVDWKFGDLREKCAEYLADDTKREKVVHQAHDVWRDYMKNYHTDAVLSLLDCQFGTTLPKNSSFPKY